VFDLIKQLDERVRVLGADWAKYSVVGSFALYVVGYLVLRFHLTVFGVATDLSVLDERYIFSGARFLVYCLSTLPIIAMIVLPIALIGWVVSRLAPDSARARVSNFVLAPERLVPFGVVFCIFMVQFVMRQCFYFSDLLLAPALPAQPAWLASLLINDELMPLYFSALIASVLTSFAILALTRAVSAPSTGIRAGRYLLGSLAVVQLLLLPVNYGILVVDQSLPRVAGIGETPGQPGEEIWLVWEGEEGITYLIQRAGTRQRSLLTLPRSEIKRIEIVGFDPILARLFGPQPGDAK
jgi:hypothetical protein